jgi:ribosomal protein S18 acetylase RimI-like enzyme
MFSETTVCSLLRDKMGDTFTVRPITRSDSGLLELFHKDLSSETVFDRWHNHYSFSSRTIPERLLCQCTNTSEQFAIVAMRDASIAGVGRAYHPEGGATFDLAFVVRDIDQSKGIGKALLAALILHAKERAPRYRNVILTAEVLRTNEKMLGLFRSQGFLITEIPYDRTMRAICSIPT